MKERKWWNSVPRVPGTWWRSPSTSHQESDQQAELPEETPGIEEVAITENHKEPEALPELPEGVTPDDILGNLSTTAKSDSGLDAAGSTSIPPRAMSTPPRRRKEFVVEGIPNISFSFFNEQAVATAASEACLSPSREAAPAMDATVTSGTTTTIVVGEDAGDYEVLRRVIPVNSTPVQHCSSLVAVLGQEPSKKSPNISRINIVSINTAAPSENPYASPRNSLPDAEQHDTGPDCAGVSVQNSSPFPDTCPPDHGTPSAETPTPTLHNSKSSSEPEAVLSSLDCTPPFSDSNQLPAQDASPPDCTPLSSNSNPLPAEDSSPSSPDCTTPTFEVSPEDSTLAVRSSEPQDIPLSSITISLPLELTDQSVYSGADWETITDFGSDYCDLHRRGQRLHTAPNSDYEDVETRHDYCDVPRRRATLMRDRRRGLGTVRTRIRRAWRAVRGWWSEERVRLGDAIQRHAHAQAVRHDKEEDKKAQEDQEARVVVLRRKSGALREGSRPSSRAGLRRSRHFPEGQNGFEELRRYIKQGGDFCKDLSSILQERSEAETQYAKSLSKLSGKLLKASKDSVGTVNQAWQRAGTQMEAQSEIHRAFATALSEEVVKPLRQLVEAQHRIRKSVEAAVDKTGKSLGEWRSAESKSKKQSFLCARENEKLQDAMLDVRLGRASSTTHLHLAGTGQQQASKDKESAKLESKRRKAEEAVKKADVEYYTFSMRAERARLEWETAVIRGSHCFQALEEERLQQLKDLAACYLKHLQEMGPKTIQGVERLREPVESCDVARDIQTVVSIKGTGQPIPEQLLPDFYAEHITLAMNRDRRRQALVKLLQLIRQDLDRERRGKQGVENLARALQQTPTFGAEDSQQNVTEKLHHMRSMLTYLEAMRYKVQSALAELDGRARCGHPLAAHIQVTRDRQGLQQSVLKVPPWVREESLDRLAGDSPDWTDRGTADGNSVQPDSDFERRLCTDEFSSQGSEKDYQSSVLTQCPVISECASAPPVDAVPSIGRCRALYEYTANLYDELNLQPGDVIKIHDKQADGWWLGELNGVVGIFPATYVQEMD